MLRPTPNLCATAKSLSNHATRLHKLSRRSHSTTLSPCNTPYYLASSFSFWPTFLSPLEQRILLSASLQRLDAQDPASLRKKRANLLAKEPKLQSDDLQSIFAPGDLYNFHEGHYDGVIHHYREMHLTSWPETPGLHNILERILALCPSRVVQTHLLHLASHGDILPHVDNVEASGAWILGVSLGDERLLRIEPIGDTNLEPFELSLPSGSVYLQRDAVRYNFKHSILRKPCQGDVHPAGQRLSVMLRDMPSTGPLQPSKPNAQ